MVVDRKTFFSKFKKWILALAVALGTWLWFPDLWQAKEPALISEELLREKVATQTFPVDFKPRIESKFATFGKLLFLDTRLSANAQVSCASCHNPGRSFTDGRVTAVGIGTTERNTPTLVNISLNSWFFLDGRADSLTAQAIGPWLDPREHGMSLPGLASKILTLHLDTYESLYGPVAPEIVAAIQRLTNEEPSALQLPGPELIPQALRIYAIATMGSFSALDGILKDASRKRISPQEQFALLSAGLKDSTGSQSLKDENKANQTQEIRQVIASILEVVSNSTAALEAYQRTIFATESPFDHFAKRLKSETKASDAFASDFAEDEFAGLNLFLGRGKCDLCHSGPNFSNSQFHNIGLPWSPEVDSKKMPSGRAQGIMDVRNHLLGCKQPHIIAARKANQLPDLSQCAEIDFLKDDALESMSAFKTPTLRNLKLTGPYMHDGRFASLEDVIEHYSSLSEEPAIGHKEETLKPLNLSKKEKNQLLKFLLSLESKVESL